MSQSPLRLGMGACFFHSDPLRPVFKGKTLIYTEQSMAEWIMSEGDIVYQIPTKSKHISALDLMEDLDGLVLQGGSDVCPRTYGEEPIRPEWNGDYIRDQYEAELLLAAIQLDRPVIGLCRGIQIINAAMGGTLYQDIQTQLKGKMEHRNWEIYDQNFHQLDFVEGSKLQAMYDGAKAATINSVHHQTIKDLAPGFVVEGTSDGGDIIEAIRYAPTTEKTYICAVQWHPEFMDPTNDSLMSQRPILLDFLEACRHKKANR